MMVDLSGTTTPLPHFGHLPFLPEYFSSTLMSRLQFEQANLIMVFPFSSPLAQKVCPRGHKVSPSFSPFCEEPNHSHPLVLSSVEPSLMLRTQLPSLASIPWLSRANPLAQTPTDAI